jgi:hypothetical protein
MWAADLRSHITLCCHNQTCAWSVLIWKAPDGKDVMATFRTTHDAILYRDGHPDGPDTTASWSTTSAAIQKGEA